MRPNLDRAYDALREELTTARKKAGVSQRDVAAALGAHQQFWSKIESGERRIDLIELLAVASILQLDVRRIFARLRLELVGLQRDRGRSK